eukprot:1193723-Pleurochrysis_carterae.AAC.1
MYEAKFVKSSAQGPALVNATVRAYSDMQPGFGKALARRLQCEYVGPRGPSPLTCVHMSLCLGKLCVAACVHACPALRLCLLVLTCRDFWSCFSRWNQLDARGCKHMCLPVFNSAVDARMQACLCVLGNSGLPADSFKQQRLARKDSKSGHRIMKQHLVYRCKKCKKWCLKITLLCAEQHNAVENLSLHFHRAYPRAMF